MSRGRKPKPAWLSVIDGNPGKRALDPAAAVQPDDAIPECPDHLDPRARAEWGRITPELQRCRLLTTIDRAALAMYCQAYSRWQLAEEKIAEAEAQDADGAGLVVAAKNDYQMLSQWLVISNRAQEQLLKYLTEFGMTPSARSRVATAAKQGSLFPEDDPIAAARRAGGKAPA